MAICGQCEQEMQTALSCGDVDESVIPTELSPGEELHNCPDCNVAPGLQI